MWASSALVIPLCLAALWSLLCCSAPPGPNPSAVSCCCLGRWWAATYGCRTPSCALAGSDGCGKRSSQLPRAGMGMGAPSWGPTCHPCSSRRVAKKSVLCCVSLSLLCLTDPLFLSRSLQYFASCTVGGRGIWDGFSLDFLCLCEPWTRYALGWMPGSSCGS